MMLFILFMLFNHGVASLLKYANLTSEAIGVLLFQIMARASAANKDAFNKISKVNSIKKIKP